MQSPLSITLGKPFAPALQSPTLASGGVPSSLTPRSDYISHDHDFGGKLRDAAFRIGAETVTSLSSAWVGGSIGQGAGMLVGALAGTFLAPGLGTMAGESIGSIAGEVLGAVGGAAFGANLGGRVANEIVG